MRELRTARVHWSGETRCHDSDTTGGDVSRQVDPAASMQLPVSCRNDAYLSRRLLLVWIHNIDIDQLTLKTGLFLNMTHVANTQPHQNSHHDGHTGFGHEA